MILTFVDFVFQSGTYEAGDSSVFGDLFVQIVGSLIGAIAGIMGSLYLFNKQLKQQEADRKIQIQREDQQKLEDRTRVEKIKAEERQLEEQINKDFERDQLEYVYALIKGAISYLDHLIEGISKFFTDVQKDSIDLPLLKVGMDNDLTRFVKDVNHQATNTYYRKLTNQNNYLEIVHYLEYFDAIKNEILGILEKARSYDYARKIEFRDSLNRTVIELRNILMNLKIEGHQDSEVYKNLNSILLTYIHIVDGDPGNLEAMRAKGVAAILEFVINYPDKSLMVKYLQLLNVASETNKMLTPVKLSNQSTAKDLKEYGDDMSKNMAKLKEEITIINKYFKKIIE